MRYSTAITLLLAVNCATVKPKPATLPASLPWFVDAPQGSSAPSDGWFLSDDAGRAFLRAQAVKHFTDEETIGQLKLQLGDETTQAAVHEWAYRYGLPVAGGVGLVLGIVGTVLMFSVVHK